MENVAIMLKFANEIQDPYVKAFCVDFIMKHFGEVIGTPAFSELPQAILREVLGAASKKGATVQDNQET